MFIFCGLHGILSAVAEFPALIMELFTVNSRVTNKQGVSRVERVLVNRACARACVGLIERV
jgi:hypothetical protein